MKQETLLSLFATLVSVSAWDANWESLDSRPLPPWYDEAKFGIFIHWGVFSVPSFGTEWFWKHLLNGEKSYVNFVKDTEGPRFTYRNYAERFDAVLYEPEEWAELFAESGAQYVVLTSKHHEGFCNWDSRDVPATWGWNAVEAGPRRDILGDLAMAVKNTTSPHTSNKLRWGAYHSLLEWFNLDYNADMKSNWTERSFSAGKTIPELYDLVRKYEPELIWSDGHWGSPSSYWGSEEFLAWYATESPVAETAVWNDRWGKECQCKNGGFLTCHDRYQPGHLVSRKWENALTIDATSWGFNRHSTKYLSAEELVHDLIETVAFGGNMLLNVGPCSDGTIRQVFRDRLQEMGSWLSVNGDAIYKTRPWKVAQNQGKGLYYTTSKKEGGVLFALITRWPKGSTMKLQAPKATSKTEVQMLGVEGDIKYKAATGGGLDIWLPALTPDIIPCQHAWVLQIKGISNLWDESAGMPSLS